jgi:hypothetical protein
MSSSGSEVWNVGGGMDRYSEHSIMLIWSLGLESVCCAGKKHGE